MGSINKLIILDKLKIDYIKIRFLLLLILPNPMHDNNLKKYRYS